LNSTLPRTDVSQKESCHGHVNDHQADQEEEDEEDVVTRADLVFEVARLTSLFSRGALSGVS
jgi:hypothetical protein